MNKKLIVVGSGGLGRNLILSHLSKVSDLGISIVEIDTVDVLLRLEEMNLQKQTLIEEPADYVQLSKIEAPLTVTPFLYTPHKLAKPFKKPKSRKERRLEERNHHKGILKGRNDT
jgi:hypothetical protein